jgi:hypothetical protein
MKNVKRILSWLVFGFALIFGGPLDWLLLGAFSCPDDD